MDYLAAGHLGGMDTGERLAGDAEGDISRLVGETVRG